MQQAAEQAAEHVAGRSRAEYVENRMMQDAVARQLGILGEALNQVLKLDSSLSGKISHARRLVRLRHVLIHAYDTVSAESLWRIVRTDLPLLRQEVEALLATPEEETEPGDTGG